MNMSMIHTDRGSDMNWFIRWTVFGLAALLIGGCVMLNPTVTDEILLDADGGTTYRNHVEVVADPVGGKAKVLRAEQVEMGRYQMTFINDKGFFAVPADYGSSVVMRVLARGGGKIKVALVSGRNLRSYYPEPLVLDEWHELVLPLSELKGKLEPGDRIGDITIWLRPLEEDKPHPDAALYLDRVTLR